MMRWIIFLLIFIVLEVYFYQVVKTLTKNKWLLILNIIVSLVVVANLIYQFNADDGSGRVLTHAKSYAMGFLLTLMVLKLAALPFLLGEDVVRLGAGIYNKLYGAKETFHIPSRRKFVSQLAIGVAAIPFASMLYGMFKGKYDFRVLRYELEFDDLPDAFDGYQITQISDIHSGSFDNKEKIEYAIDLINKQESDVILFTGDMVNNKASEMIPWKESFSKLEAKDGKYSVLGNHDYGDYVDWNTSVEKDENLQQLKDIQKEIGFDLMLNENRFIEKEGERIALVGVENWGAGGFKKAGDLKKATQAVHQNDFKVLLSHDPTHWEEKVVDDDYHYHLTLSGHTHGMQFGIEIPGWVKWSPASWRYKHWAGIYKQKGQYINVNRGFGFLAYPGRVGIWPEITVIELKKSSKIA
ncbi:metallophosphoesterase [Zhouia amylolytica]|uniref:metallophosphoesterase n=1 Tax=Zhouia amylolytica TaxID=376730 RepID=UPI0020CDEF02|nr:metallophosphoesterase [Zhouia amylolytica]MCQ0110362.1 metallophosphoesterase [Zhouia amylolytica]